MEKRGIPGISNFIKDNNGVYYDHSRFNNSDENDQYLQAFGYFLQRLSSYVGAHHINQNEFELYLNKDTIKNLINEACEEQNIPKYQKINIVVN